MTRAQELSIINRAIAEGKLHKITIEEARASLDKPIKLRATNPTGKTGWRKNKLREALIISV